MVIGAAVLLCAQFSFMQLFGGEPLPPGTSTVSASKQESAAPKGAASPAVPEAGGPARLTADMVAALPDEAPTPGFIYEPAGKRDPFRPFDFSPKQVAGENLTPLEQYNIGQLKLTAVLGGFDEPAAIVENAAGKGFTVKKGMKIGPNGGIVTEILPDKLVIVETTTDFSGATKSQTLELLIRTNDQKKEQP